MERIYTRGLKQPAFKVNLLISCSAETYFCRPLVLGSRWRMRTATYWTVLTRRKTACRTAWRGTLLTTIWTTELPFLARGLKPTWKSTLLAKCNALANLTWLTSKGNSGRLRIKHIQCLPKALAILWTLAYKGSADSIAMAIPGSVEHHDPTWPHWRGIEADSEASDMLFLTE